MGTIEYNVVHFASVITAIRFTDLRNVQENFRIKMWPKTKRLLRIARVNEKGYQMRVKIAEWCENRG